MSNVKCQTKPFEFPSLNPYDQVPFTVVNIAAPLLAMGNAPGAVGLLSAAFQGAKTSPKSSESSSLAAAIGAMLAVTLAESGDLSASCGAAQEAVSAAGVDGDAPCASLAWMTLADVYARIGSPSLALATLNNMPSHFLDDQEKEVIREILATLEGGNHKSAGYVEICRLKKAFGDGNKKVLLGWTPKGEEVCRVLLGGMVRNGGRLTSGQAPRGANERALQEWLERS